MILLWPDYFTILFGFVFVVFCLILYCHFLDVMRALRGCQPSWDARMRRLILPLPFALCIILMYIELCLFIYINNSETHILFKKNKEVCLCFKKNIQIYVPQISNSQAKERGEEVFQKEMFGDSISPQGLKKLKREPMGLKAKTLGIGKTNQKNRCKKKNDQKKKSTRTPNGGASVLVFIPFLLSTNLNFLFHPSTFSFFPFTNLPLAQSYRVRSYQH